jgi:catechol 2,3-dioxygenase-like lactoylglutathione lyase family enzyme
MSVSFKSLTPMLQTHDMQRTIDWYRTVLGFRRVGNYNGGWSCLKRDGVSLMFMHNDHLGAPHATATQYIHVDDVLALWDSIKDQVTPEWGPEEMPYG